MKKSFFFLVIIFAVNIPSLYYGWYLKISWFDSMLHFLGGFFVSMFMYHYLSSHLKEDSFLKNMIIIVGTTAMIGVLWEFAEYFANQMLIEPTYRYFGIRAYFMGDLTDTMTDLSLDMLGGSVFYILHSLINHRNKPATIIEN